MGQTTTKPFPNRNVFIWFAFCLQLILRCRERNVNKTTKTFEWMLLAARNEFHFLYSIHKSLEPKSKDRVIDSNGTCWNRMDCFVSIVSERTANGRIYFGDGAYTYAASFTFWVDIEIRCFVQHHSRQPIFKIQVETLFRPTLGDWVNSASFRESLFCGRTTNTSIDATNLFNLLHVNAVRVCDNRSQFACKGNAFQAYELMVKNGESTCSTHLVFVNVQRPQIRIE